MIKGCQKLYSGRKGKGDGLCDFFSIYIFFYTFLLEIKSSELLYDFFGRLILYAYCFDVLIINMLI